MSAKQGPSKGPLTCAYSGGGEENRTLDLSIANARSSTGGMAPDLRFFLRSGPDSGLACHWRATTAGQEPPAEADRCAYVEVIEIDPSARTSEDGKVLTDVPPTSRW